MKAQRLRVAPESFALQGIPWEHLDISFDPLTLHSLAGNAWTATVCMAFFLGMVALAPIPSQSVGGTPAQSASVDTDFDDDKEVLAKGGGVKND